MDTIRWRLVSRPVFVDQITCRRRLIDPEVPWSLAFVDESPTLFDMTIEADAHARMMVTETETRKEN